MLCENTGRMDLQLERMPSSFSPVQQNQTNFQVIHATYLSSAVFDNWTRSHVQSFVVEDRPLPLTFLSTVCPGSLVSTELLLDASGWETIAEDWVALYEEGRTEKEEYCEFIAFSVSVKVMFWCKVANSHLQVPSDSERTPEDHVISVQVSRKANET
jgi:hypothetical protein